MYILRAVTEGSNKEKKYAAINIFITHLSMCVYKHVKHRQIIFIVSSSGKKRPDQHESIRQRGRKRERLTTLIQRHLKTPACAGV